MNDNWFPTLSYQKKPHTFNKYESRGVFALHFFAVLYITQNILTKLHFVARGSFIYIKCSESRRKIDWFRETSDQSVEVVGPRYLSGSSHLL